MNPFYVSWNFRFNLDDLGTAGNDVIDDLFRCNLHVIQRDVFIRGFGGKSRSLDIYKDCMKSQDRNPCMAEVEASCKNSSLKVIKVIRQRMDLVPVLLRDHPDLSLIYYTRDPRGIMHSRVTLNIKLDVQFRVKAAELCNRMVEDFKIAKTLQREYPDRVLLLRYEDLAMDAKGVVSEVYQKLGFRISKEVSRWIKQNTNSREKVGLKDVMNTKRNSTHAAFKWKTEMPYSRILIANQECMEAIETLRYD